MCVLKDILKFYKFLEMKFPSLPNLRGVGCIGARSLVNDGKSLLDDFCSRLSRIPFGNSTPCQGSSVLSLGLDR